VASKGIKGSKVHKNPKPLRATSPEEKQDVGGFPVVKTNADDQNSAILSFFVKYP
jgi:hypothetical protein